MKNHFYILVSFLSFVSLLFPQSKYKVELNGGRIISGIQMNLLPYWDTGWSLGISVSKQINKEIELTSSIEIHNFRFQPHSVGLVAPAVVGHSVEVTEGENSKVYNLSLGIRIHSSTNRFTNFFSFGGGIQFINQGKIFITFTDIRTLLLSELFLPATYLYNPNNRYYFMGFFSAGTGLLFKVASKINLIVEGKIMTTLKNFTTYPYISTGIQYSF